MIPSSYRIAPLDAAHDRSQFDCGVPALDRYLREQVTQDMRRRVAACFVALTEAHRVAGYYTLATGSVSLTDLPSDTVKRLPRYPTVPAVRMGRLAVDRLVKGRGLGSALLADALKRCIASDIAAFAIVVDAKDEGAAGFYRHHGFIALPDSSLTLFLPLATAKMALAAGPKPPGSP